MNEVKFGGNMPRAVVEAFLAEPGRNAIVATLRKGGGAQLTPVWYLYENARVYFVIVVDSVKYRNLKRNPRITLCVDAGHPDFRYATIYGTTDINENDDDIPQSLRMRIARRYLPTDEEAQAYLEAAPDIYGPGALVTVIPSRIIGFDIG